MLEHKSLELFERNKLLEQETAERIRAEKSAAEARAEATHRAAIEERENRLRAIFDSAVDAIIVIDHLGNIESTNPAVERLFGYPGAELVGSNVNRLMPEPFRSGHDGYLANYMGGGERKIIGIGREVQAQRADGSVFPIHLTVSEMRLGEQRLFTGIVRDISALKTAEADLQQANQSLTAQVEESRLMLSQLRDAQNQLVQSEKLASLGELVAGVAHEINTPVGVAVTASSYLRDETRDLRKALTDGQLKRSRLSEFVDGAEQSAQMILTNLQRAAELVQSFKQVAVDRSSSEAREIALSSYIHEVLTSLKPKLRGTQHQVQVNCPEDLSMLTVPGALSQVITNLVMNSLIHAFDSGAPGIMQINVEMLSNQRVQLEYRDDGAGIPEHLQCKVFNPFFTTKRGSGGSGLGMHIVYNLVHNVLGGQIALWSAPQQGVRFTLTLPHRLSTKDHV